MKPLAVEITGRPAGSGDKLVLEQVGQIPTFGLVCSVHGAVGSELDCISHSSHTSVAPQ